MNSLPVCCNLRIFNFENETQEIQLFKDDIKKLLVDKKVYVKKINADIGYDNFMEIVKNNPFKISTIKLVCQNPKQYQEFMKLNSECPKDKRLLTYSLQTLLDPYQMQTGIQQVELPDDITNNFVFDENFYITIKILPYTDLELILIFKN